MINKEPLLLLVFILFINRTLVLSPEKRYASSILLETLMKGFTMPVPRSKMKAVKQKPVQVCFRLAINSVRNLTT
jgi:hypothetical protein